MGEWLPELTDDDLETLMEALVAWESKDAAGEMFSDVVEFAIGDPAKRANFAAERQRERLATQRAKTGLRERSVILRAKLLTLRDRRRVNQVIGER